MAQINRRDLELAQCKKLDTILRTIPPKSSSILEDAELRQIGVVRGAELNVDDPKPCDFEARFFSPCHDMNVELNRWRSRYNYTLQKSDPRSPDSINPDSTPWVRAVGYKFPSVRARWFVNVLEWSKPCHMYNDGDESASPWNYELWPQDQLNFQVPNSYHPDELSYLTEYVLIPHAEGTSHMPIMMVNVSVAPEGKMLRSELEAALYIARAQHANGRFTDHKIKPVLIYSFQWDTHARITQAHFDPTTEKLVIRQSRQLDLRGVEPPPDALILLRWLMNSPAGETKYSDGEAVKTERGSCEVSDLEVPQIFVMECL